MTPIDNTKTTSKHDLIKDNKQGETCSRKEYKTFNIFSVESIQKKNLPGWTFSTSFSDFFFGVEFLRQKIIQYILSTVTTLMCF